MQPMIDAYMKSLTTVVATTSTTTTTAPPVEPVRLGTGETP